MEEYSASIEGLIDQIQHRLERAKEDLAHGGILHVEQQVQNLSPCEDTSVSISTMSGPTGHHFVDNRALVAPPRLFVPTPSFGTDDRRFELNTPIQHSAQDRTCERLIASDREYGTCNQDIKTRITSLKMKGGQDGATEPIPCKTKAGSTLKSSNQDSPKHMDQPVEKHSSCEILSADRINKLLNHFRHSMLPAYQEGFLCDESLEINSVESQSTISMLEKDRDCPLQPIKEEGGSKAVLMQEVNHRQINQAKAYDMMLFRLESAIEQSQISMERLQKWDKQVAGLKRSHSKTMVCSKKSRNDLRRMIKRTKHTLSAKAA